MGRCLSHAWLLSTYPCTCCRHCSMLLSHHPMISRSQHQEIYLHSVSIGVEGIFNVVSQSKHVYLIPSICMCLLSLHPPGLAVVRVCRLMLARMVQRIIETEDGKRRSAICEENLGLWQLPPIDQQPSTLQELEVHIRSFLQVKGVWIAESLTTCFFVAVANYHVIPHTASCILPMQPRAHATLSDSHACQHRTVQLDASIRWEFKHKYCGELVPLTSDQALAQVLADFRSATVRLPAEEAVQVCRYDCA